MNYSRSQLSAVLGSFSGDYRELFFEYTQGIQLCLLNDRLESPSAHTVEGMSFLSRSGKTEYSASYSDLENFDEKVHEFIAANSLANTNDIQLSGAEILSFEHIEILPDLGGLLQAFDEISHMSKPDFLKSYEFRAICTRKQYIVANSFGCFQKDAQYYNSFYVVLVGCENDITEETMVKITGMDIVQGFTKEKALDLFQQGISQLKSILTASPAPSGVMDVLIGAESGGTIIHEAIGHGLEADLQSSSVYRGRIGQQVAHPSVTVIDDPTRLNLRGHYAVDHEGSLSKKTYLIKDGVLVSYMHNNKTAKLFGVETTGHGRREDYTRSLLVRMGSTYLDQGTFSKEEMIASVSEGIYVARMGGGEVNTVTGDFVFKVDFGYRIRNGKLAEPIRGANIFGNGPEMLQNIRAIGNDLDFFDGGSCGKSGQSMPVSLANPSILVNLKVTGLE